jgi:hypothetical protein
VHWRPCNYKNKLKVNIYNLSIYLQNCLLQVECLVHPDCWSEGHRFKSWQHVEHCHFIHMQLLRPFYKSTRHLRPNIKIIKFPVTCCKNRVSWSEILFILRFFEEKFRGILIWVRLSVRHTFRAITETKWTVFLNLVTILFWNLADFIC